jgi:flagellar basal-body rod protein FlgC
MSMFNSIGIAQSGIGTYKAWIDAISDNVANVSTTRRTNEAAYQARSLAVQSDANGNGVRVSGVRFGNAEGRINYDPNNPLADDQGNVRLPDMNLSDQMTTLIIAQRAYQANVTAFERARDGYLRELEIGK